MMKKLLLLSFVLVLVFSEEFKAVDYQGTQIIDTHLSYMFNLRFDNGSKKLYFRADKSSPNVFTATFTGPSSSEFKIDTKPPLGDASPAFFAFDVITNLGVDYVVGSIYDTHSSRLPLAVASTNGKPQVANYNEYYLYTPVIDGHSLKDNKVDVYFAGWRYENSKGMIVVKVTATLDVNNPQIVITPNDVLPISDFCYDIWSDVNKPHLFIDTINTEKFLILAVTGRCDGIWKIKIDKDSFVKSSFVNFIYKNEDDINKDIFSYSYDFKNHRLFYALKKYNSDDISLHFMDMTQQELNPSNKQAQLGWNDTNPILAYDRNTDSLLFISSEFDHIYKIPGDKIDDTSSYQIATLPPKLKFASAARVFGDFLYIVTYEPDAQFARIQLSKHFCKNFCGTYGFCEAPDKCACAPNYTFNVTSRKNDSKICVPKHEVDVYTLIERERGVAIALGILFTIATIAALAGWLMWWRARKSQYQNVGN